MADAVEVFATERGVRTAIFPVAAGNLPVGAPILPVSTRNFPVGTPKIPVGAAIFPVSAAIFPVGAGNFRVGVAIFLGELTGIPLDFASPEVRRTLFSGCADFDDGSSGLARRVA